MRLFSLEGNTQSLDGGSMFGNAPKAMWEQWIKPDEKNRIPLACRSLLVQTDEGKHVLFELGVGAFFEPKFRDRYGVVEAEHVLLENLAQRGISDEDIDMIVLSHLHFDHIGGILAPYGEEGRKLFPNARLVSSKRNMERAKKPHPRDRASFIPDLIQALEERDLELLDSDSFDACGLALRLHYFDGHTPGMMCSELQTHSGPLFFAADLIPGLAWMHLAISMGYDRFPELVIDEKKRILEMLLEKNGALFFTHDPHEPCALVRKNEKAKFYGEAISLSQLTT